MPSEKSARMGDKAKPLVIHPPVPAALLSALPTHQKRHFVPSVTVAVAGIA
jgi:hypothetical protein